MRKRLWLLVCSALLSLQSMSLWAEPRVFDTASLQKILYSHQGKPFILVFWSMECPPCLAELSLLSKRVPQIYMSSIVLVSMDSDYAWQEVEAFVRDRGLAATESWMVRSEEKQRLYYSIKRGWQGELPRSELVAANGDRREHIGSLQVTELDRWLDTLP